MTRACSASFRQARPRRSLVFATSRSPCSLFWIIGKMPFEIFKVPDFERAVFIRSNRPLPGGGVAPSFGSGFLVSPGKIVTARHVISTVPAMPAEAIFVEICLANKMRGQQLNGSGDHWFRAKVVWPPVGVDSRRCDIAVLEVQDDRPEASTFTKCSRIQAVELPPNSIVSVIGLACPRKFWLKPNGASDWRLGEIKTIEARFVNQGTTAADDGACNVHSIPPDWTGLGEQWAGASGGVLHTYGKTEDGRTSEPRALAVLIRAHVFDPAQLYAIPLSRANDLDPSGSFWTAAGMECPVIEQPVLLPPPSRSIRPGLKNRVIRLIDRTAQIRVLLAGTDKRRPKEGLFPATFLIVTHQPNDCVHIFRDRILHELRQRYEDWDECSEPDQQSQYGEAFEFFLDDSANDAETIADGIAAITRACIENFVIRGTQLIDPYAKLVGYGSIDNLSAHCLPAIVDGVSSELAKALPDFPKKPIVLLFENGAGTSNEIEPVSHQPLRHVQIHGAVGEDDLSEFVKRANQVLRGGSAGVELDATKLLHAIRDRLTSPKPNSLAWAMQDAVRGVEHYLQNGGTAP